MQIGRLYGSRINYLRALGFMRARPEDAFIVIVTCVIAMGICIWFSVIITDNAIVISIDNKTTTVA